MSEQDHSAANAELGKDLDLKGFFPPHTYEDWKNSAEAGLKGASFDKKLIGRTPEGIDIQPLYLRGDMEPLPHLGEFPGLDNRSRGGDAAGHLECGWEIAQETADPDPATAGKALRDALHRGQTAVTIALSSAFRRGAPAREDQRDGIYLTGVDDMAALLSGVDWSACPLHFTGGSSGLLLAMMLENLAARENRTLSALRGSLNQDHLGVWVRDGKLLMTPDQGMREMATLVRWGVENAPNLRVIAADGLVYHEAGADAVSELAFTLATAVEYLAELGERDIPVDQSAPRVRLTLGIGTHFLMEIAKLRAARILWSRAVKAFGGGHAIQRVPIHARTSRYYQTRYDAHVNILRAATGAFSAVVGGADSIHTSPFDESFRIPGTLSRRVARNTQIILDAESHFRNLIDPAGGAYAVEVLTHQVASRAWDLFRQVESRGGMTRALMEGFPQERIHGIQAERASRVATRRTVIVGSSHYANVLEEPIKPETVASRTSEAQNRLEIRRERNTTPQTSAPGLENNDWICWGGRSLESGTDPGEILSILRDGTDGSGNITGLKPLRAATPFETLRDRSEDFRTRTGNRPGVFLANLGPPEQHRGRSEFSRGFFEAAGFLVESPSGFDSPETAAAAAADSTAPVVVICSTDDTYPELVPPLIRALKERPGDRVIVLAGYPKEHVDTLRRAGVDEFIHIKVDALNVLSGIQERIGVTES